MVDIFELRAILENCQTWATRVLRPWISRQIDLWKQHCPDHCPRPFDGSLRRRAAQSKNTSNRPLRNENAPEEESGKNENKDVDLRRIIREEHERLLKQLSKDPIEMPPIETKRPTRSIATQTGPASPDVDKHPLEKSAVRPPALDYTRHFPPRKILAAKPRLTKKIGSVGALPSSDKGQTTVPAGAPRETDSTQRPASNVDLFKNTKKVFGEKRIFTVKLPDVSSEEILAQKPWLGANKSSEAEKQTETALIQKSEQAKDKDGVGEGDDEKKVDEATHDKSEAEDESEEKSDNDRVDDKSDDKLGEEKKSKEEKETVLPLTKAIEVRVSRRVKNMADTG